MYVKPNIRAELTAEQAGLVIHAIDPTPPGSNAGGLTAEQVENLAQVAHNPAVHINSAGA